MSNDKPDWCEDCASYECGHCTNEDSPFYHKAMDPEDDACEEFDSCIYDPRDDEPQDFDERRCADD